MELWLDIHLSPSVGRWITAALGIPTRMMRDLGFRTSSDRDIFFAARQAGSSILSKDIDFEDLVQHHGAPPHILLLKCGNTSNSRLIAILASALPRGLELIRAGAPLVIIEDPAWPTT